MALLSVVFSNCPSSFSPSPFTCSNKRNKFAVIGKERVGSLRKRSHLIKCSNRGLIQTPPLETTLPEYLDGEDKLDFPKDIVNKSEFPTDFVFGAGTSAYQIEGAYREEGKGLSIWDTFTYEHPEKINGESNGEIAIDSYNKYKEDIHLMKKLGVRCYRFSIAWSRILPKGKDGETNKAGIEHYNKLIDELIANDIKPFVTLFHFDTPHYLEEKYGGFLSRDIVDDFKHYCDVCFESFGDRVKYWTTVNEPLIFAKFGYEMGTHAPGRCTPSTGCAAGDSAREPYIVAHNLILAHATAAKVYKENYKAHQGGEIGIVLLCHWYKPYSDSTDDQQAALRALDFATGWFMGPLVDGNYPFIMRALVRERLPSFTDEEKEMVQGSADFIGINYYTARYAKALPVGTNEVPTSHTHDTFVQSLTVNKEGVPIGELATGSTWIYSYPEGLKDLLVYIKKNYKDPKLYITENGVSDNLKVGPPMTGQVPPIARPPSEREYDRFRINYIQRHLYQIKEALGEGVKVNGYFVWSLMDSMEWEHGYSNRFGLYFTDYRNLQRHPKKSALWFRRFLNEK